MSVTSRCHVKFDNKTHRRIALFKKSCVDVIETDFVVQPCGDQGKHEGKEVDEDGDSAGVKGQHLLDLNPFELCKIVPEKHFKIKSKFEILF